MRVCDRHPRTPAKGKIIIESTDEHFDLCDQCLYQIKEFICDAAKEAVEPKIPRKRSK